MDRGAAAVLGLFALMAVAPPASAASPEASLTYSCLMAQQDLEVLAATVDLTVTLQLDVPTDAAPGDRIAPTGTLTVTLPETHRQLVALASSDLQIRTALLSVRAVAGGVATTLPSGWESATTPTSSSPLTMTGPVRLPGYTIPDTDEVTFGLPDQNALPPVLGDQPVALNFEAAGSGRLGGTTTYLFSCPAPPGSDAGVVQMPVAAEPPTEPTAAEDPPVPVPVPVPTVSATPASLLPTPAELLSAAPTVPRVPVAEVSTPSSEVVAFDWAAAYGAADADGILIKPSVLGWVTSLVTAAALLHAAWSTRRLRVLAGLRDRGDSSVARTHT